MRSYNAIEAMDFEPSDSAKVGGSNQASATTIYFLSIISQYPATASTRFEWAQRFEVGV